MADDNLNIQAYFPNHNDDDDAPPPVVFGPEPPPPRFGGWFTAALPNRLLPRRRGGVDAGNVDDDNNNDNINNIDHAAFLRGLPPLPGNNNPRVIPLPANNDNNDNGDDNGNNNGAAAPPPVFAIPFPNGIPAAFLPRRNNNINAFLDYRSFEHNLAKTLAEFQDDLFLKIQRPPYGHGPNATPLMKGKLDTSALKKEEHSITIWRIQRAMAGQVVDTKRHDTNDLTQVFLYLNLNKGTEQQDLDRNRQIVAALSVTIPDCPAAVQGQLWYRCASMNSTASARAVYPGGQAYNILCEYYDNFCKTIKTVKLGVEWLTLLQQANIVDMVKCTLRNEKIPKDLIKAARNYQRFLSYLRDVLDVLEDGISKITTRFCECVAFVLATPEQERREAMLRNNGMVLEAALVAGSGSWWDLYVEHAQHYGNDVLQRIGAPTRPDLVSETTADHIAETLGRMAIR